MDMVYSFGDVRQSADLPDLKSGGLMGSSLTFCNACLFGMLEHELYIDDLVPGLENAIVPNWERIKSEKRR